MRARSRKSERWGSGHVSLILAMAITVSSMSASADASGSMDVSGTAGENATTAIHEATTHHSTEFTAFLFPLIAIIAGCLITHFTSRYLRGWVPYSPAMLIFGMLLTIFDHVVPEDVLPHVHESLLRWRTIDGHLLLLVFLPPLLFADAVTLDWHVAKRSLMQCLLLAFPGVIMGCFLTAAFAIGILPQHWPLSLALSFGAVLSATDPVAVVSLLKELGAPASLTMIIAGESMLNDGSAIVVWRFCFGVYVGEREADIGPLLAFLARLALGGVGLGLAFGAGTLYWLALASRRLEHSDVTVQVAITITSSYVRASLPLLKSPKESIRLVHQLFHLPLASRLTPSQLCFYIAEMTSLDVSGVLAVVVQATFLAAFASPVIASRSTMTHVWHTIEWLFLTLLFVLAGAIMADILYFVQRCDGIEEADRTALCTDDLPYVLVTYAIVVLIRYAVVFTLLPALRRLGYGMSLPAAVMAGWGGLRGAVGLALALSMHARLGYNRDGKLIILHVSGVALLTLLVNAPTSASMLRLLGLTVRACMARVRMIPTLSCVL